MAMYDKKLGKRYRAVMQLIIPTANVSEQLIPKFSRKPRLWPYVSNLLLNIHVIPCLIVEPGREDNTLETLLNQLMRVYKTRRPLNN